MTEIQSIVFVVDDDASVRQAVTNLLRSAGLAVQTFASAQEFVAARRPDVPSCLVLDVRLPHISGLDLQRQLAENGIRIPIIMITGHGDIQMSVRAMKAGAVEFLTKPFRDQDLLDAVQQAIKRDGEEREKRAKLAALRSRFEALTSREREVMTLVVRGLLNKQIAEKLGTAESTVKLHRGNVMRKMNAASLSDLIRIAEKLHDSSESIRVQDPIRPIPKYR